MTNEHKLLAINNPTLYALYVLTTAKRIDDLSYIADNLADFYEIKSILSSKDTIFVKETIELYGKKVLFKDYRELKTSILHKTDISEHYLNYIIDNLRDELKCQRTFTTIYKVVIDIFGKDVINKLISKDF